MSTRFHNRAEIGLGAPVLSRLAMRSPIDVRGKRGLSWHWTGAGGTLFKPDPIARLRGIYAYHVHTLGYGDIAYEGAFDADGNTFALRDPKFVGAHAQSTANTANRLTEGIVFLEDKRGWTPAALEAFVWWSNVYRLGNAGRKPEHFAHRYWGRNGGLPTFCPGDPLAQVVHFIGGRD